MSWLTNKPETTLETTAQNLQFSKNPILNNFGELEFGHIPEPLKFSRPF
jgi:hypothetical protein